MELKAVLFDMDGVLIDSEHYYMKGTFNMLKEVGFKGKLEDVYIVIGTTLERTYELEVELMNNLFSVEQMKEMNDRYFMEHPLPFKDIKKEGVNEILDYLKNKGIKIALCSSSPLDNITQVLKECEIQHYFDFVVSGEQFTESKPHPEIYLHAADVLGVKPDQCIVVEDSNAGVTSGYNAKMIVIGIQDEILNHDQSLATVSVSNLIEAKGWIEENIK